MIILVHVSVSFSILLQIISAVEPNSNYYYTYTGTQNIVFNRHILYSKYCAVYLVWLIKCVRSIYNNYKPLLLMMALLT